MNVYSSCPYSKTCYSIISDSYFFENNKFSEFLKSEIKNLMTSQTVFKDQLTNEISLIKDGQIECVNDLEVTFKNFSKNFDTKIFALITNLDSHKKNQLLNYNQLTELNSASKETISNIVDGRIKFLNKLKNKLACELTTSTDMIQLINLDNSKVISNLKDDIHNIEKTLSTMKVNLDSLENNNQNINDTNAKIAATKIDSESLISLEVVEMENDGELVQKEQNIILNHIKQIAELDETHFNDNKTNVKEQIDECHNLKKNYSEIIKKLNDSTQSHKFTIIETNHRDLQSSIQKVSSDILNMNQLVTHSKTKVETSFETLSKDFDNAIKETKDRIECCKNEIDAFKTTELKYYESTGDTPIKKTYSFSKTLPTTSPYEQLIERFNKQHNNVISGIPRMIVKV